MKIQLLPSAVGTSPSLQFSSSFLVNGRVAVDAGSLGLIDLEEQRRVEHVLLSHPHIDHVASLPIFLENVYTEDAECVTVHGSSSTMDAIQRHLFNDEIWPDFVRLSDVTHPFLRSNTFTDEVPIAVAGLSVTPVLVDHVVPTHAFVVDDGSVSVAVITDTGPTDRIWEILEERSNLAAVFLEASFPESHARLAGLAKHLTPSLLAQERTKLRREVPFLAIHLKPAHHEQMVLELEALGIAGLQVAEAGRTYQF